MSENKIASPYSTGGGGTKFEHEVGALYLAALLTEEIPAGLQGGKVAKVQFQALHTGILVDDIVITISDDGSQRIIAYQIKHKLTFAKSDLTFREVIKDYWNSFAGNTRIRFNSETDMLGIGVGIYSQKLDEHLQQLIEWAGTSLDSKEFLSKGNMRGFSSSEKRELIETIKSALIDSKGSHITDDELWRFFRCLIVYHFDMKENGRDRAYCINSLRQLVDNQDSNKAKALFNALYSIVGKYAETGGSIDKDSLVEKIRDYIVDKKSLNIQKEFSSRARIILNENVFKKLVTVEVRRDSVYSISLKVSDGRLANRLPYIRHAEAFLANYYDNIHNLWFRTKNLVSQYNENAADTRRILQDNIRAKMRETFLGIVESDHFHLISPNSFSMPSLLEITWNYCEQKEKSEIVQLFSANFSKLRNSNYGWVLSRELRGMVSTADFLITSSIEQHADPNVVIPIIKSIGDIKETVDRFNKLKSILEELHSLTSEFIESITNLSEEIELKT